MFWLQAKHRSREISCRENIVEIPILVKDGRMNPLSRTIKNQGRI